MVHLQLWDDGPQYATPCYDVTPALLLFSTSLWHWLYVWLRSHWLNMGLQLLHTISFWEQDNDVFHFWQCASSQSLPTGYMVWPQYSERASRPTPANQPGWKVLTDFQRGGHFVIGDEIFVTILCWAVAVGYLGYKRSQAGPWRSVTSWHGIGENHWHDHDCINKSQWRKCVCGRAGRKLGGRLGLAWTASGVRLPARPLITIAALIKI